MKYLLKQQIRRITKGGKTKVFPGNPGLIKLANEKKIPYEKIEKQEGEHIITESYILNTKDYEMLYSSYSARIFKKRCDFYAQDSITQLIKLLKYIFKRNTDAKIVDRYSASINAYEDKSKFLEISLNIAKIIPYPFFRYGYERDPSNSLRHYIYYFEIESLGQISFHSEMLSPDVPLFQGKWSGVRNDTFPFNLKDVRKLIRGLEASIKNET